MVYKNNIEYGHGITNRMTGGAHDGQCLQSTLSGGMGEGWSDTFAVYLQRKETDTRNDDVVIGDYVIGDKKGIRSVPYSTDMNRNPLLFSSLQGKWEVHDIGELWCTMLNEVYWNLVDKLGFSSNWHDSKQVKGNIVAMQAIIGGLAIQPCNPDFINARDAIIQAEMNYYGGSHACEIWKAFAKRGMGVDATTDGSTFKDGFNIPKECL
jgi:hypothetical protein